MEGYRSVSLKGEVVEELQKRAKKEKKSLSTLVGELLEQKHIVKEIAEEMLKGEREIVEEKLRSILEEARRSW
ncbi:hypothetical protein DRN97_06255 [Methanosarcinales archaeon]|nr:MAG: hypothetical protein DRN97_06255 [Methanosarcinales archaeon]